ncbi:MAG: hypothetical protein ACE14T_02000 [Syntrophales bacterium]
MKKDAIDKTENEILKERAEVLGRAGEYLSKALTQLKGIENSIDAKLASGVFTKEALREINSEIRKYNRAREYAKLRYYYLIVTREAVGFRRHTSVEENYKIPPRKKPLKRFEWTGIKNND